MTLMPLDSYKRKLIADISSAPDFDSLEECLLDAQMEIDSSKEADTDEELLVKILKISHQDVMAGKRYSQEEVDRFLDHRLYELGNKMVGTSVAESC